MATIPQLLCCARSWMETPFRHQGRLRGIGVDCGGLVLEICRELHLLEAMGVPADWDHRTQGYSRYSEGLRIHEVLSAHLPVLLPALMAPGDIVTLRDDVGDPSHMGLLGDAGRPFSLIHAWCAPVASRAKVQEHRLTGHWRRALYRAYRLPLEEYPAWPA